MVHIIIATGSSVMILFDSLVRYEGNRHRALPIGSIFRVHRVTWIPFLLLQRICHATTNHLREKTKGTMPRRLLILIAVVVSSLVSFPGCGGSGSAPPPRVSVRILISPTQATVQAGNTQFFLATVTGTANKAVTWQVNGITGGNATLGTIDASGLYTAPNTIPNPPTVGVTVMSQADPTKTASASVTVTVGISVSPSFVSLNVGGVQQQFNAVVTGSANAAVSWTVNGLAPGDPNTTFGTITASGLYTSPDAIPSPPNFNVTATSVADPTRSGCLSVRGWPAN